MTQFQSFKGFNDKVQDRSHRLHDSKLNGVELEFWGEKDLLFEGGLINDLFGASTLSGGQMNEFAML